MKRRREKERREEERKKKRRRREEEKFKEKRKAKLWICKEFWYGFLYGYLFGGLEYLFLYRILAWNGSLVWLWSSIEEKFVYRKCWGLGEMLFVFFKPMFLFWP